MSKIYITTIIITINVVACGTGEINTETPTTPSPDASYNVVDGEAKADSKTKDSNNTEKDSSSEAATNPVSEAGSDSKTSIKESGTGSDATIETDAGVDSSPVENDAETDASSDSGSDSSTLECTTGTKCEGLKVFSCDNGQWVEETTCPYLCSNGSCTGSCVPTTKDCSGLTPRTCNSSGEWVSSSACSYVCSGGSCTGVCTPNNKQCSNNASQTCNASGQWETTQTCPYTCSGAGVCSGSCVPTTKQCSGTTPQTCDSTGNWISGSACDYVCSSGNCTGVCIPGTHQCSGLNSQTCNSNGSWVTDTVCPYVCTGSGICSGSCVPTSKDCQGDTPRTCGSSGAWINGSTCPFVCSVGVCTGVCVPGTTQCSGSQIQTCNSSGQWGSASNCPTVNGATSYCSGGSCTFDCNLDYDDCDGNPANGCEINLTTDGSNCGNCGHSCCGGACSGAVCEIYDTGITPYSNIYDVDANNIYWSSNTTLNQRPRTGSSTTILASSQPEVRGIDAYGSDVFWSAAGTVTVNGGVYSKPIGGGALTTYSTPAYNGYDYLIVTNSDIFRTNNDNHSAIYYISKSDNYTSLLLGSKLPDGSTATLRYQVPFVTDGTYLYATYTSYPTNQKPVVKVPIHGGSITTFASYTPTPPTAAYSYAGLSTDETNLYYVFYIGVEPTTTGVWKQPFAGGAATQLASSGIVNFWGTTATDGTNVYYAATPSGQNQIRKVSINGGSSIPIAYLGGTSTILNMKVSNQCVYWINNSTSTIQSIAVNP